MRRSGCSICTRSCCARPSSSARTAASASTGPRKRRRCSARRSRCTKPARAAIRTTTTSRVRVGTTGRELGDILRWRDPAAALAVYDVALARLAEVRNNVAARRDQALVLANSSYALRRLGRQADGRRRVDEALASCRKHATIPPTVSASTARSIRSCWRAPIRRPLKASSPAPSASTPTCSRR